MGWNCDCCVGHWNLLSRLELSFTLSMELEGAVSVCKGPEILWELFDGYQVIWEGFSGWFGLDFVKQGGMVFVL